MMNEPFAERKPSISDFNEAKYQILRLHVLWQSCNSLSQSGHLVKWKWKLDTIWRELAADAKELDEKKYFGDLEEKNEKIADYKTSDDLYQALQQKEIFLRCLQEAAGKGSKRSSSDDDDIDE